MPPESATLIHRLSGESGTANAPSPPSPLPLGRERGAEGRVRALDPRAYALGYNLPPLTGLRKHRPHEEDFVSELLTHYTGLAIQACQNTCCAILRANCEIAACRSLEIGNHRSPLLRGVCETSAG